MGQTTIYSSDYGVQVKPSREKNEVTLKIILHLK